MLVPLDGGGQRDGQGIDDVSLVAMGKTRGPYNEEYPVGSRVRIVHETKLEEFRKTWKWHHPLQEEQLRYSGATSVVQDVAFITVGTSCMNSKAFRASGMKRASSGNPTVKFR